MTDTDTIERTYRNGFLSTNQILGDAKNTPILPISRTTFYTLIKRGIIPQPTKIAARNYWHCEVVNNFVENIRNGAGAL